MRAASLKRKLEELHKEERIVRNGLREIDKEMLDYKAEEMRAFVGARCPRIVRFSRHNEGDFTFDNGIRGDIAYDFDHLRVYDGEQELGIFYRQFGIHWSSRAYENLTLAITRVMRLTEILPVIQSLLNDIFPAWVEASKELDVESLMTSRVLRWISKQIGGQWPDIVSGNFPLK